MSLLADPKVRESQLKALEMRRPLRKLREEVVIDSVWYEDASRGLVYALPKKLIMSIGPAAAFEWAHMRKHPEAETPS